MTVLALSEAAATAASVTLAWDPSTSTDITSYKVYYGTAPASYTQSVAVGNTTNATVTGLTAGVTYFFAATALDITGLESAYSTEINYTIPASRPIPAVAQIWFDSHNRPVVSVSGAAGQPWQVMASTNLLDWLPIGSVTNGANGTAEFTDTAAAGQEFRFYRFQGY